MESFWLAAAKKSPIYFAQVREDALIDIELVKQHCPEKPALLMVASGGCTAAALIGSCSFEHLHVVDPNPSQLYLTLLKLYLLKRPYQERLELLGHTKIPVAERKVRLQNIFTQLDIPHDILGDLDDLALHGIDYTGRYEQLFQALRGHLKKYTAEIQALFSLNSIEEQSGRVHPKSTLGKALDKAFEEVMSLPTLIALFGESATANRLQEFSIHFAERTRHMLCTQNAAASPYLAQVLLGRFHHNTLSPWLTMEGVKKLPEMSWSPASMQKVLGHTKAESYDAIHLSNILDWLNPAEAKELLENSYSALKENGIVIIRQLNSNLEIPKLGAAFSWLDAVAKKHLNNDRSFFYRNLYIGKKECLLPRK
jgi:S-adenosylmethionine-diacylglycerol 3-amino-3-carboxypropyl transferase